MPKLVGLHPPSCDARSARAGLEMAVSLTECDKLGKDVTPVLEFQRRHGARRQHIRQNDGLSNAGHDKLAAPTRWINQYNVDPCAAFPRHCSGLLFVSRNEGRLSLP